MKKTVYVHRSLIGKLFCDVIAYATTLKLLNCLMLIIGRVWPYKGIKPTQATAKTSVSLREWHGDGSDSLSRRLEPITAGYNVSNLSKCTDKGHNGGEREGKDVNYGEVGALFLETV